MSGWRVRLTPLEQFGPAFVQAPRTLLGLFGGNSLSNIFDLLLDFTYLRMHVTNQIVLRARKPKVKSDNRIGGIMKLSVEAKVAASVAAGFVALTVAVIAQGNSADLSAGSNGYGPTSTAGVSTHMSQHGYDSSLIGRTNAEQNGYRTQWQNRE